MAGSKIYFASDFHLGAPTPELSRERELRLVRWLSSIQADAKQLFLVGDVFDFWFEYKTVIPKGYIRLLGKLAELRDAGIEIHFFIGNHDLWMFRYLTDELGIPIHNQAKEFELLGKRFFIGHGDGLGPKDYGYKFLKKIFRNRLCMWLFGWIHPDIGTRLASYLSRRSRASQGKEPEHFLGEQGEWLLQYSNRKLEQLPHIDFFIFGHRHLPLDILLHNQKSRYINLGEWLNFNSYAVFDGETLELRYFESFSSNEHRIE